MNKLDEYLEHCEREDLAKNGWDACKKEVLKIIYNNIDYTSTCSTNTTIRKINANIIDEIEKM